MRHHVVAPYCIESLAQGVRGGILLRLLDPSHAAVVDHDAFDGGEHEVGYA